MAAKLIRNFKFFNFSGLADGRKQIMILVLVLATNVEWAFIGHKGWVVWSCKYPLNDLLDLNFQRSYLASLKIVHLVAKSALDPEPPAENLTLMI